MTKPLQVGSASSAGVEAAELASLGWTAATDIIEAPLGFFKATGGQVNADAVLNRLWTALGVLHRIHDQALPLRGHPAGSDGGSAAGRHTH